MPPINPYEAPGASRAPYGSPPMGGFAQGYGEPAPLGLRLVAQLLNAATFALSWVVTFVVLCGANGIYLGLQNLPVEVSDTGLVVILTSCCIAGVIPHLMFLAISGQSVGKWVTHTRVVSRDGSPASKTLLFLRAVLLNLSLLSLLGCPPFGIVAMLFLLSDEHRGVHERVTSTMVVRAPR